MLDARFAEHLAVFLEAARAGSFSAVARSQLTTPSAIARKMDALEVALDAKLFVRSTRVLRLTDAGRVLLARSGPILDGLADLKAEVSSVSGAISGPFRLACFPTFGKRFVIPAVEALQRRHPALTIDLDLTERLADPVLDRMDVVIRIGALADSSLFAAKIGVQHMGLYASPSYLAEAGVPDAGAAVLRHRLLNKTHGADLLGWRHVVGADALAAVDRQTVFRCDDFEALGDAACRGMGMVRLATWVAAVHERAGRLVRLPQEIAPSTPEDIWLLRALQQPTAKLTAFTDALRVELKDFAQ